MKIINKKSKLFLLWVKIRTKLLVFKYSSFVFWHNKKINLFKWYLRVRHINHFDAYEFKKRYETYFRFYENNYATVKLLDMQLDKINKEKINNKEKIEKLEKNVKNNFDKTILLISVFASVGVVDALDKSVFEDAGTAGTYFVKILIMAVTAAFSYYSCYGIFSLGHIFASHGERNEVINLREENEKLEIKKEVTEEVKRIIIWHMYTD